MILTCSENMVVTYKDTLGQLKSEKSWNDWRNNSIDPLVTVNEPREGFILNRNGGGSWGHFDRAEFVRVYDPLGFEILINSFIKENGSPEDSSTKITFC